MLLLLLYYFYCRLTQTILSMVTKKNPIIFTLTTYMPWEKCFPTSSKKCGRCATIYCTRTTCKPSEQWELWRLEPQIEIQIKRPATLPHPLKSFHFTRLTDNVATSDHPLHHTLPVSFSKKRQQWVWSSHGNTCDRQKKMDDTLSTIQLSH